MALALITIVYSREHGLCAVDRMCGKFYPLTIKRAGKKQVKLVCASCLKEIGLEDVAPSFRTKRSLLCSDPKIEFVFACKPCALREEGENMLEME